MKKEVKKWKPNWVQRFLYRIRILKHPKYKEVEWKEWDEWGQRFGNQVKDE